MQQRLRMPPDLVIRAAGIWNSRAPFANYLREFRLLQRRYALAVLAADHIERDLQLLWSSGSPSSLRSYFSPRRGARKHERALPGMAWFTYKRSFGREHPGGPFIPPTLEGVSEDLVGVIAALREATIVNHVGLLEAFLNCWLLNYLLAKLEAHEVWTNDDRTLAMKLSPVHGDASPPGLSLVIRCVPELRTALKELAPDPKREADPANFPLAEANVLSTLELWIAVRNVLVHRNGWVSMRFAARYGERWNALNSLRPHLPALEGGRKLRIHHEYVVQVSTVGYRAARSLARVLAEISSGRRGHLRAPHPWNEAEVFDRAALPVAAPLLIEGDHEPSLRWQNDSAYRADVIEAASP